MDPITQGVLGAAVGHAVAGRQLGKTAIVLGAVGGMSPDLDIFWVSSDASIDYWRYHRGITHSLFFGPVVAVPLAAVSHWASRRFEKSKDAPSRLRWYALWMLALITHPMLDAITHWGTMLFAPLSQARYGVSALPVIDPFYTLILFIGLWSAVSVGMRSDKAKSRVNAALVISTLYIGCGWFLNGQAELLAKADLERRNMAHGKVYAYTTLFTPLLRRVVAETTGGHVVGFVSILAQQPIRWRSVPSNANAAPFMEQLAHSEEGRIYFAFANGPLEAKVAENSVGTYELRLTDMRYGYPGATLAGLWGVAVLFDSDGAVRHVTRYAISRKFTWKIMIAYSRALAGLPQDLF